MDGLLAHYFKCNLWRFQEELEILSRHELVVTTRGVPGTLTTEKEFVAFKGFDGE